MGRFFLITLLVWIPLFVLFLNHSKWKLSVAKAAGMATVWACVSGITTAIIFGVVVILFD